MRSGRSVVSRITGTGFPGIPFRILLSTENNPLRFLRVYATIFACRPQGAGRFIISAHFPKINSKNGSEQSAEKAFSSVISGFTTGGNHYIMVTLKGKLCPLLILCLYQEDLAMRKLIILYWGTVFLMYLSQVYYPAGNQLHGHERRGQHFLRRKSDIFMMLVVFWLTCFSFLRVNYNDSPLSSKRQKNNCMTRHLAMGAVFCPCL